MEITTPTAAPDSSTCGLHDDKIDAETGVECSACGVAIADLGESGVYECQTSGDTVCADCLEHHYCSICEA